MTYPGSNFAEHLAFHRDNPFAPADIGNWETYTPTLTNLNVGSTGTVEGHYAQVGDVVVVRIIAQLGGTGISVGDARFSLPVQSLSGTGYPMAGQVYLTDAGSRVYFATPFHQGTDTVRVRVPRVFGDYLDITNLSATVPFTWVAGDDIRIQAAYLKAH